MKSAIIILGSMLLFGIACKKVKYEWENYTYTAVPVVTIDTTKTALPTKQTGKVAFFNLKDPDVASQQFAFTLSWEGFGKETVTSIEVYNSYNKAEASVPAYPLVISTPGNIYPNIAQFPLPSIVGSNDHLYETVTTFPKTYSFTAAQLADMNHVNLANVGVNDYFLFKFILNLADGRRIVTFFNNICDEARGEPGDCRVGVRFKKQ
ncbi:hypothetical protein SAMN05660909_04562 [Chitinophaga terrae (ex Kim and Jung 2007)]|uniref:Uncharacterized protein n=1 Tax=Chitinophaga terrae (ex Kim and Jung 2007) TaxID=408074 RepID=A0A1H4FNW9_9BACT|nr:hypothetical protein [Chitinophaga terrae (ex Kim and Jung 2007)]MDQ0106188.1 hypothetical protein [Chitinophaga terrae (ex Kim and Jung 2007)]GEP92619.1 hypothetical protein CTE07_42640 [Chitinophaga terrae (ex Kim and Jung 2007)]SEA99016.1 hypothetical protein SAMN05660909_04562 [Chitinophaga terrae (ex Kim and Jung 2007)]